VFFDFYDVNMSTKSKTDSEFFCVSSVTFFLIWLSSNHVQFLQITLFLLKSVRANLIYLEE